MPHDDPFSPTELSHNPCDICNTFVCLLQETLLWRLSGVSRIGGPEALIVASEENRLSPQVRHVGYLGDVWGPLCYSWCGGEHHPNPQSTWATLFLSRKPESNSSHMSVITEESDETLMSLSVFPSLSVFLFSYFYSEQTQTCPNTPRYTHLLKRNTNTHTLTRFVFRHHTHADIQEQHSGEARSKDNMIKNSTDLSVTPLCFTYDELKSRYCSQYTIFIPWFFCLQMSSGQYSKTNI